MGGFEGATIAPNHGFTAMNSAFALASEVANRSSSSPAFFALVSVLGGAARGCWNWRSMSVSLSTSSASSFSPPSSSVSDAAAWCSFWDDDRSAFLRGFSSLEGAVLGRLGLEESSSSSSEAGGRGDLERTGLSLEEESLLGESFSFSFSFSLESFALLAGALSASLSLSLSLSFSLSLGFAFSFSFSLSALALFLAGGERGSSSSSALAFPAERGLAGATAALLFSLAAAPPFTAPAASSTPCPPPPSSVMPHSA